MEPRRSLVWDITVLVLSVACLLFLLVLFTWEVDQLVGMPPPHSSILNRRPSPRGAPELFPPPMPLLDLPAVYYLSNTECGAQDLLLVILVHSHPANVALRNAHRTHVSWEDLAAIGARRVFVLADASGEGQAEYPSVSREVVVKEAALHRDLVVGDFSEHYRNLTYKHVLALTWAESFCPSAAFILKMDDDTMVDVWGLAHLLRAGPFVDSEGKIQIKGASDTRALHRDGVWTAGILQRGLRPLRKPSKWRVSHSEYPGYVYPDFLSGWAYVATRPAAAAILQAVTRLPPFWIDDVHVTGTAAVLAGVPRYALSPHYSQSSRAAECCIQQPSRRVPSIHSEVAPLCGLLVAPSDKNLTLMDEWLEEARRCHVKHRCPITSHHTCSDTFLHQGVATIINLS